MRMVSRRSSSGDVLRSTRSSSPAQIPLSSPRLADPSPPFNLEFPLAVGVKPAENMFKVRGDHNKIQECRIRYDRGEVMPLKGCADAHTVAGVLKLYLASLPEPLLTFRLYDSLLAVAAMPSRSRRVLALGSLLDSLDISAKRTLSAVSAFLRRCAQANARGGEAGGFAERRGRDRHPRAMRQGHLDRV